MTDIDERMDKLDQMIVLTLEKLAHIEELFWDDSLMRKEEELIYKYGEYVYKSTAARILGVSRATVYAMLADGRIMGACSGRRVDVRSIARYIFSTRGMKKHRGMKNGRDADAACSNANRATE